MGGRLGNIEELKDTFYRCKFNRLLVELDAIERAGDEGLGFDMALIKASALFELHRVDEAKQVLKNLENSDGGFNEDYLHAVARLDYMDGKAEDARNNWREILEKTEDKRHRFKSLLGIANCYYSDEEYELIPPLINQLCAFEPLEKDDDRISLLIFLGNYYLFSGVSASLAKSYFTKALGAAANRTWNYFINRSLYGMAAVAEKSGQHAELLWTLNVLRAFVDESESLCFSHFVNTEFKDFFSIDTQMEFDSHNKRIMIKDRWIHFHDKPMLFQFLEILHQNHEFVGKDAIASDLWPQEEYKPKVHDPRIFDIAKRARTLIETYENQPVVLLSGRLGYKLASA